MRLKRLLFTALAVAACDACKTIPPAKSQVKDDLPADAPLSCTPNGAYDLCTIVNQVYPDRPNSEETFSYVFSRQVLGGDPEPTLIYLAGGPGTPTVGANPAVLNLPKKGTVIFTDVRSVAHNKQSTPPFADDALRSEYIAADVLRIIQVLNLSNYAIHGNSYGTVLATMVAAKAAEQGLPPPRAVVLEGTMGKAYQSGDTLRSYSQLWQSLMAKDFEPQLAAALRVDPPPAGLTATQWADYLAIMLRRSSEELHDDLEILINADDDASRQFHDEALSTIANVRVSRDKDRNRLHRVITCAELMPKETSRLSFAKGDLVLTPLTTASASAACLTRPYDSAAWTITAPIYYINGDDDPATPLAQVAYHCENQKNAAAKYYIQVPHGGHAPIAGFFRDCGPTFWEAVLAGGDPYGAIATCHRFKLPAAKDCPSQAETAGRPDQ